jgi:hypothetical protein
MESIYKSLDSPDFDINSFKGTNPSIDIKVSDILNEGNRLNNEMSHIISNSNKEIEKYKNVLNIKDDNLQVSLNQIQWNYYYYKKYKRINEILRNYIIVCIVLIILSRLQSPYFDNLSYTLITGLILALLFLYVMYSVWDIFIRDNINFDEYNFNQYGSGISKEYDPNNSNVVFTKPEKSTYDYSGCLFYSNSGNVTQNIASASSDTSQPQSSDTSQPQSSDTSQSQSSDTSQSQSSDISQSEPQLPSEFTIS